MNPENNQGYSDNNAKPTPHSAFAVKPEMPSPAENIVAGVHEATDELSNLGTTGPKLEDQHRREINQLGDQYGSRVEEAVHNYGDQQYAQTMQKVGGAVGGVQERVANTTTAFEGAVQREQEHIQTGVSGTAERLIGAIQKTESAINGGIEKVGTKLRSVGEKTRLKFNNIAEKVKGSGDAAATKIRNFRDWDARVSARILSSGAKGIAHAEQTITKTITEPVIGAGMLAHETGKATMETAKRVGEYGRYKINQAYEKAVDITTEAADTTESAYKSVVEFKDRVVEKVKEEQRVVAIGFKSAYLTSSTQVMCANAKSSFAEALFGESTIGLPQEAVQKLGKDKQQKQELRANRRQAIATMRQSILAQAKTGEVQRVYIG